MNESITTPSIEPFPYASLPKLTQSQAKIHQAVAHYFPSSADVHPTLVKIKGIADKLINAPTAFGFESIFESKYKSFVSALPEKFLCYAVSLTPYPWPIVVEWDYELALDVIDQLLGGTDDGNTSVKPALLRPISELERGTIEYWGAYWLNEINEWMAPKKFKCLLNRTILHPDQLAGIHGEEESVVLITLKVNVKKILGYVRLCIPQTLFSEILKNPGHLFENGESILEPFLSKRFSTMSHLKAMAWAEVGKATLASQELNSLEKGDIILFDESLARYENGLVSGQAIVRFGEGNQGGVIAEITEDNDHYKLKTLRVFLDNA